MNWECGWNDWKDWKLSEIQEFFRRISEISSSKDHNGTQDRRACEDNKSDDVCLTKDCIAASHNLFKKLDLTADPCEDFNQFCCGTFLKEQSIPDDKSAYEASFSPTSDISKICKHTQLQAIDI